MTSDCDGNETEPLAGQEEPFLTDDLSEALVTSIDVKETLICKLKKH